MLNGVLLVDKPLGLTSHDVVDRVRRIICQRLVGHAGTLDPLATGLLVLLLGEGTKLSDFLLTGDKGYEAEIKLGFTTATFDAEGELVQGEGEVPSEEVISSAIERLRGVLNLQVPAFSAIKQDGVKLYKRARAGEAVEAPFKEMDFKSTELIGVDLKQNLVRVRIKCSKGSYIRSYAHHLGSVLGCGGYLANLRRIESTPFKIADALSLEALAEIYQNKGDLGSAFLPMAEALSSAPAVVVEGQDERLLRNGQISKGLHIQLLRHVPLSGETPLPIRVLAREGRQLLSLLVFEAGRGYRIKRSFVANA